MRAAIYARISRVTERTTSVDRQLDACRSLCEQRGWTVADVYPDHGVSGATNPDERPQMGKLLRQLGRYDALVFFRIDRLARSTVAFSDLVDRCRAANVSLVSVSEPIDLSTPMGRAMAEVIAVFAKLEREMIRERSMDARASLLEAGKFVGGRFPFGITPEPHPSGSGRALVRDEDAVPLLREIAERIIAGESATKVAMWLNGRRVPTSRMRGTTAQDKKPAVTLWRANSVRALLRNPQLIGHRRLPDGRVEVDAHGVPVQVWEPVLSMSEWVAVQSSLDRMRRGPRTQRKDSHWLQPVTRCGVCGWRVTTTYSHGLRGFKCGRQAEEVHTPSVYVRVDALEEWVLASLHEDFGRLRLARQVWAGGVDHSDERHTVRMAIDRMRSDREMGLYDGPEDEEQFRTQMASLIARRRALEDLPDDPGGWETHDTGQTLSEALEARPEDAADVLRMVGLVVRVFPAGSRRKIHVGERAAIEWEDEESSHQEDFSE